MSFFLFSETTLLQLGRLGIHLAILSRIEKMEKKLPKAFSGVMSENPKKTQYF